MTAALRAHRFHVTCLACLVLCLACASAGKGGPHCYAAYGHEECVSKDYGEVVSQKIYKEWWSRMPLAVRQGSKGTVSLRFDVVADGTIVDLVTLNHSGPALMERAATKAVEHASPLPAPEFRDASCSKETFTFHFYYNTKPATTQDHSAQD